MTWPSITFRRGRRLAGGHCSSALHQVVRNGEFNDLEASIRGKMELAPAFSRETEANPPRGHLDHHETQSRLPSPTHFVKYGGPLTLQQPSNKRRSWVFSPRMLVIPVVMLALTYWLLRCLHRLPSNPRAGAPPRALAGQEDQACISAASKSPHNENEEVNGEDSAGPWRVLPGAVRGSGGGTRALGPWDPQAAPTRFPTIPHRQNIRLFPEAQGAGSASLPKNLRLPQRKPREDTYSKAAGEVSQTRRHLVTLLLGAPVARLAEEGSLYDDLRQWEGREMPESAKTQATNVLKWMQTNASLCTKLLSALQADQAFNLAFIVLRIITFDLAALSLVPRDLEPLRYQAGESLLDLIWTVLPIRVESPQAEAVRTNISAMERLVLNIKLPRPCTETVKTRKRKFRTLTLLTTMRIVGKYCTKSLSRIQEHAEKSSEEVLRRAVDDEIRILTALWEEHRYHLIRDRVHRHFALASQERTGVWLLIPKEEVVKGTEPLPEYKVLLNRLDVAVEKAGGQLLPGAQRKRTAADGATGVRCRGASHAGHSSGRAVDAQMLSQPNCKRGATASQHQFSTPYQRHATPPSSVQKPTWTASRELPGRHQGGQQPDFQAPSWSPPIRSVTKPFMRSPFAPTIPPQGFWSQGRRHLIPSWEQLVRQPHPPVQAALSNGLPTRDEQPPVVSPQMPPQPFAGSIDTVPEHRVLPPAPHNRNRLDWGDTTTLSSAEGTRERPYNLPQDELTPLGRPPTVGPPDLRSRGQEEPSDSV
ncbi:hypothetical protein, conserved [Eimeria maxima]|uniref:Uncharacterized protein n=1 Tax=Eimeria maxima TaxID=5804 RepID=U6M743_EIMMA|nr:hypothetical protein, conserved [Eimeria maxima]CDJ58284.1 hypothetical protein, conserved [Eimeria maxima]